MNLEQLQLDAAGRLAAVDTFAGTPVKHVRPRSEEEAVQIQSDIDLSLAGLLSQGGKSGTTIIVQMPTLDAPNPDIPGPEMVATLPIRVFENPMINMGSAGTLISCESLALAVLGALHHCDLGDGNMLYAEANAMAPNLDFDGLIVYDVALKCRIGVPVRAFVPMPKIEFYSGTAALTCCDSAAAIRYTLDGSYPSPTSTLYTAAISTGAATILRAVAYRTNYLPSAIAQRAL